MYECTLFARARLCCMDNSSLLEHSHVMCWRHVFAIVCVLVASMSYQHVHKCVNLLCELQELVCLMMQRCLDWFEALVPFLQNDEPVFQITISLMSLK